MERETRDELGAHVSVAGGVQLAPERAAEIDSVVVQVFTKQPNRWAEKEVASETAAAFRDARERHGIRMAVSHDSYLINLATPDEALFEKSYQSFRMELERCTALGLEYLVTHPGNATDGDMRRGIEQNARAIDRALAEVGGSTMILLETTAGGGKVLGASFEHLAELIDGIDPARRHRVGVCFDTCHVWAAGYDLRGDYDAVFDRFDRILGLDRLRLFHLNDSIGGCGSRRDRHADIGQGTLGDEPFRRLMNDDRFRGVPKVLETPKGDDAVAADRANLDRLRGFRV
ncbi:MAG TPA: deoxyribonuclease IV [Longimicrobiales bacterium]